MSMLDTIRMQSFEFTDVCAGRIANNETIIQACSLDTNFLQSVLTPFMLVTGGFLPVIFWAVIALGVYLKYHNSILAMLIGFPVIATATLAMPEYADIYIPIMLIMGVATTIFIVIWKIPRD